MSSARRLTAKQSLFVDAYIANGGNGTDAAMRAYDTSDRPCASVIAYQNLKHSKAVREAIGERMEEQQADLIASRDTRLAWLAGMAEDGTAPHNARIRALEILSKLAGDDRDDGDDEKSVATVFDSLVIARLPEEALKLFEILLRAMLPDDTPGYHPVDMEPICAAAEAFLEATRDGEQA